VRVLSVRAASVAGVTDDLAVVELRQYTLRPGQRDTLIGIFDREFVESQEATGMRVLGQFRDLDRPDHFVWLRSFPDMAARHEALTAFYRGPVWKEHGRAAAGTMLDSDDVLLLRPAAAAGIPPADHPRAGGPGPAAPARMVAVTVFPLPTADDRPLRTVLAEADPLLPTAGREFLAELVTEPAENTYPDLPVRAAEHVVVRMHAFDSAAAHRAYQDTLRADPRWTDDVRPRLTALLAGPVQRLRLAPTDRSQLR
jgi:NIPSNAP